MDLRLVDLQGWIEEVTLHTWDCLWNCSTIYTYGTGLGWDGMGWDVAGPFACHVWVRSWVGWILKLEVGNWRVERDGTGRDEMR